MGLFSATGLGSSSDTTSTGFPQSASTTTEAPDRHTRAQCWAARDAFFACLDRHDIIDSLKAEGRAQSDAHCKAQDVEFGKECVGSWVTYFKQRRIMEFNKKQTLEKLAKQGGEPLPPAESSASASASVIPSAVAAAAEREGREKR